MLILCFWWLCWGIVAFLRDMGFNVGRESVRRWFLKAGEILSGDGCKE